MKSHIEKIPLDVLVKVPLSLMPYHGYIWAIGTQGVYFRVPAENYQDAEQKQKAMFPVDLLEREFDSFEVAIDMLFEEDSGFISEFPTYGFLIKGYFKEDKP